MQDSNFAIEKHIRRKTGHDTKVYPSFVEKKFSMPQNDIELIKENHDVLEGKSKRVFAGAEIVTKVF